MGQQKKSFGQHFLHEARIIEDIIAAAEISPEESVLEVGPGEGALTVGLSKIARHLVLLEADRDLLPALRKRFPAADIHFGDAAKMPFGEIMRTCEPWVFVSNLPYNAGNAILMQIFSEDPLPRRLVVMVQKEVGERMLFRESGTRGVFGVAVQMYAKVEKIRLVAPGSFTPPPKVDSMVLRLTPHANVPAERDRIEFAIKVAKAGFANRRKKLSSNLSVLGLDQERVSEALVTCGLLPDVRAQELDIETWQRLARELA